MSLNSAKTSFVIDVATSLFLSQSIEQVTIKDIAVAAGVGEATIYRYFGRKQMIVAQAIMKLQAIVSNEYFKLSDATTGFDKLNAFYQSYLNVFKERPEFFHFLREFDTYMEQEDPAILAEYENEIDHYKESFLASYQLGLQDGSIKAVEDIDTFYFASTHALIELCKKLAYGQGVLNQDRRIQKNAEISCLIDTLLTKLKNSYSKTSLNKK